MSMSVRRVEAVMQNRSVHLRSAHKKAAEDYAPFLGIVSIDVDMSIDVPCSPADFPREPSSPVRVCTHRVGDSVSDFAERFLFVLPRDPMFTCSCKSLLRSATT